MRVLQNETGIPPETLRSWENRHGFPSPARTPGNQRRYTERDLVAIRWLLEQTKHGRGISNAIEILKRHLPDPPPVTPNTSPAKPVESPLSRLTGALRQGDLAAAQTRWDDLVLGLSPLAIGDALLRLHLTSGLDERARAFLLRKATVLLDDAGPDTGDSLVAIITPDASGALLPATVAAAALARS
ncbi:MAG TPA: MerR family transcriptional regulator, partial [Thermomicrobiales bacterium]|nr:MerR family transcriptional regulator [Thermomicrobiales bacterium]